MATEPGPPRAAPDGRASRPVGATYRLQLGPELDFAGAARIIDYLASLGVTHLYLSPVLQARAGSTHGYDVADPGRVSQELGGREGLEALAAGAHERGLGLVVDTVPNHVGVAADNPLWDALLAAGRTGEAGAVFDVDWTPALPGAADRVILPVLGAPYGEVLHAGDLVVREEAGTLRLRYHDHSLPLSEASLDALERSGGAEALAGTPGEPRTWGRLHALLEQQHYRLVHWRAGDALVNYRRFFAISDLAAVRIEDEDVYRRTHGTITALVAAGVLDGLRIDHVDGLTDPAGYVRRLRADVGDAWVVVEKILGPGERLPGWPVAGTTGYEFLGDVLRLQVDPEAEAALTGLAGSLDAWPGDLAGAVRRAKLEVLAADLAADADRLAARLWALCQEDREVRDVTLQACGEALRETFAALDVYRTYTRVGEEPSPQDRRRTEAALAAARGRARSVPPFLWRFLEGVLMGSAGDGPLHREVLRRFHQLAGAAAAKGVEDTFLYRQHRLAALNEVGVEPGPLAGDHVEAFHAGAVERAAHHPAGMLTTATHDTKRGEDVRLRIAALSELAGQWREAVTSWIARHRDLVVPTPRGPAPDAATEYLLYQTLVGIWPLQGAADRLEDVRQRLVAYLVKASREAKLRTSWTDPDPVFEEALAAYTGHLLDPGRSQVFLDELGALCAAVDEIAMTTGLAQVLLRSTAPGVPDTYQGNELWDDSLVDPDNRRPVDFDRRARLLADLDRRRPPLRDLVECRRDGRVKLWVLSRSLRARRDHPMCLGPGGDYRPLTVEGRFARNVVAFARVSRPASAGERGDGPRGGGSWDASPQAAVVVAPRLPGAVIAGRGRPPLGEDWGDTAVRLAEGLDRWEWRDALGGPGAPAGERLPLARCLAELPVALLVARG